LKKDVLSLILQAEGEYDAAVRFTIKEAQQYTEARRREQAAYIEGLRQEWLAFENAESEKLEQLLTARESELMDELEQQKVRLKLCQEAKAGPISERIKEEVLSLHGDSPDGKNSTDI